MSRATPNASASGSTSPADLELEKLEELSDDAIVAHQQGAHMPQPRAQITEEARSIVISDHPPAAQGSEPPRSQERRSRRRSERTEKTVVIRSRRQLDELRRAMGYGKRAAKGRNRGLLLWGIVGLAAFVGGGLVALMATPSPPQVAPAAPTKAVPSVPTPPAATAETVEPPSVSIDELPIEGSHPRRK